MEKVKLTREQAEAIKNLKRMLVSDDVIVHNTVFYQVTERERDTAYRPFKDIDLDILIKALYIGYEVEETFKAGDWVKDTSTNAVIKIKDKQHRNNINDPRYSTVRHATPEEIAEEKQRRWWAKHGRKVWELKDLDILINEKTGKMYEVDILKDETIRLWKIGVDGAFASDYKSAKEISKNVEVFCFAEDRKDNA